MNLSGVMTRPFNNNNNDNDSDNDNNNNNNNNSIIIIITIIPFNIIPDTYKVAWPEPQVQCTQEFHRLCS